MRTISVRINKEDERATPFDCPAGKTNANCVECNYRVGRVMVAWEEGATVRCRWEECMKMEKMASMGVIVDRREDIWFMRFPKRIREIEADFD